MCNLVLLLAMASLWRGSLAGPPRNSLVEVFSWKTLDFQYPDEQKRQAAIDSGEFIVGNSVPMGLEVWRDKLFLSVPRLSPGVPSSLNYVKLDAKNKTPKLIPYPNWEAQNLKRNDSGLQIVSPFRMNVDQCDRLWMVDLGITDIRTTFTKLFQPRILAFDLKTDQLVLERAIEPALLPCRTWIANIIIDVEKNDCGNAWAYIPDLWGKVLIVYSLKSNEAFQVNHQYFNSDPLAGNYFIGGFNFRWDDGIFGVALSPYNQTSGDKTLYFHSLSAYTEFSVSTKSLQNQTAANEFYAYRLLGARGNLGQSGAQSMDAQSGVIFKALPHKNAVGCWNSQRNPNDYSPKTSVTIYQNNVTMLYPSDLKVDRSSRVWVVSNRLPVFNNDALDNNDVNFRVLSGRTSSIIENTPCDPNYTEPITFPDHHHHHHNRNRTRQSRRNIPLFSLARLWSQERATRQSNN